MMMSGTPAMTPDEAGVPPRCFTPFFGWKAKLFGAPRVFRWENTARWISLSVSGKAKGRSCVEGPLKALANSLIESSVTRLKSAIASSCAWETLLDATEDATGDRNQY